LRARLRGADPSDRAALNRAAAALLRRGYGWDEINAAVERLRAEAEESYE
jgi:SOS response regulatory protein OraA/RecX